MVIRCMKKYTSLLNRYINDLLADLIPAHIKRLIFICSVFNYMRGKGEPRIEELEALNNELSVAMTSVRPMRIAARLATYLWGEDGTSLRHADADTIRTEIIDKMPRCLVYARYSDIVQDVVGIENTFELQKIEGQ